ncbi:MAG: hypothetical protein EAZ99_10375 [Alphaproteobacteria bacterium]|nr:MAG: hypothetical protein EAZ99_10375 [Alphaproteobacteria bacterium]
MAVDGIQAALAAPLGDLGAEILLEQATSLAARRVAASAWQQRAMQVLSTADAEAGLLAAAFAVDAEPRDPVSLALLAEFAARVDAPEVAAAIARTLVPSAADPTTRAHLEHLASHSDYSRLAAGGGSPDTDLWFEIGEQWREQSRPRVVQAKIMAARGDTPKPLTLHHLAYLFHSQGLTEIALALLNILTTAIPSNVLYLGAQDQLLTKSGKITERTAIRSRIMSEETTKLLAPLQEPISHWNVIAGTQNDLEQAMLSLRSIGFVVLRSAIDRTVIEAVADALFGADPLRDYADPAQDLSPALRAQLLAPLPLTIIRSLGLVGPDASTSHARQLIPGRSAASQLVTAAYHQDAIAFFQPLLNMWIPLDRAGEAGPGLALLPDRTREVLPTESIDSSDFDSLAVARAKIQELLASETEVIPIINPGDTVLFLGTVPHRTHLTPAMTAPRRSIELRFAPPNWVASSLQMVENAPH